ncbi:phage integrase family protein [Novosphingobium sp. PhB165]|uniref:tyrosine-type recombinase/integrase n=1 Tax=Novosphingobium sp. PhB165 TaxID=2485105 RepID=UPI0010493C39|nr:integrase family protein [Novosphingobium sp. PhB165]TCM15054.1 phage integrase family protein [Novosphingobium sp. PhB165]
MTRKIAFSPASLDTLNKGSIRDPLYPGLSLEVLPSGKKVWRYARRISGDGELVRMRLGTYPAHTIADARNWAKGLNDEIEVGIDPREARRLADTRDSMTVARAHELYMEATREGRGSRSKRKNKPRTIQDKLYIYRCDIAPRLAKKSIYAVTERDLINLVLAKGRTAKVRANRLAAELKVFFGWAASLRGLIVGLEVDPSRRLADLRFPETPRSRKLSLEEIGWLLEAVAKEEERDFRRGMLLWLLTAARFSEVIRARSDEIENGVWTIPAARSKNSAPHSIQLGPWGRHLISSEGEWVFPSPRIAGPRTNGWYPAKKRALALMAQIAGREIDHFVPHDFRRTARSNTKRLKVDYETAEAMLNHLKVGMERIYDGYELEEEKAAWFLKWESEIVEIAHQSGVARLLEIPEGPIKPPA